LIGRFRISPSWLFVLPAALFGMALEHRSSAGETPCPIGANKKSSVVTKQPHRPDGPIQKTPRRSHPQSPGNAALACLRLDYTVRTDLVFAMPFSNVLHLSFPDKIKATRLAGFQQMTIQPQEVLKLVSEGLSIADMKAIAADPGVQIGRLDPLCPWVPDWKPNNFGADYAAAHDISPAVFFDLCDKLDCRYMSLNATFPATRYTKGSAG
jgi:hypothetical protein